MIILINIILAAVFIFLFPGIINRTKAVWGGRKGPRLFQSFYDFVKLLGKSEVISPVTSFIFKIAPSISLAAMIAAALVTPLFQHKALISFSGDFIFFMYMTGLAKFASILAAMDTGSSFEGMGAAREANFSLFVEPALFLLFGSLAMINNNISFLHIFELSKDGTVFSYLVTVLTALIFFIILLIEGCRVPFDDPNTHLELTMIHEVMILDNSGPNLAYLLFSNNLKMVLFAFIITNLILPAQMMILPALLLYPLLIAAVSVVIGLIESLIARFKMAFTMQIIFSLLCVSIIIVTTIMFYRIKG